MGLIDSALDLIDLFDLIDVARPPRLDGVIDRDFDTRTAISKGKYFEAHKVPLRRLSGTKSKSSERDAGLMHQKFAVIDRKTVFTGSYNWTHSAENANDENLLLFRDAGPLAEDYRQAFLRLWERKP